MDIEETKIFNFKMTVDKIEFSFKIADKTREAAADQLKKTITTDGPGSTQHRLSRIKEKITMQKYLHLKEFESFLKESPFKDEKIGSTMWVAMYGSFLGGISFAQENFIKNLNEKKS